MLQRSEPSQRVAGARARLWWLIAGRIVAALLLLGASVVWTRFFLQDVAAAGARAPVLWGALPIGAAVLALSIVYAAVLRLTRLSVALQAGAQFFCDALLVTWLVSQTGDLHSPYAALYILVIAVASLYLGSREVMLVAAGCALFYTTAMLSISLGFVSARGSEAAAMPLAEVLGTMGLNAAVCLVVGLLAARLAERQTRSDV